MPISTILILIIFYYTKKSYENISINYTAYKTPHSEAPCILFLIKQMGILENIALNIKRHLILMKNIRKLLRELDILLC